MTIKRRSLLITGGGILLALAGCGPELALPTLPTVFGGGERPLVPPGADGIDLASHLLTRLGCGAAPGEREELLALAGDPDAAASAWLAAQLHPEGIDDGACERRVRRLDALGEPVGELFEYRERVLLRELTAATVVRAVHSRRQLHEAVVRFWTDHFNVDISKGECAWLTPAQDRDAIRKHALGKFSDLLRAVALGPAMLWYLDGRVNRRATPEEKPNENYARELLELHTLGVHGGYSQQDVMEAARCLTGWSVRDRHGFFKGRVEFHSHHHDDGAKTVLGQWIPAKGGEHDVDLLLDRVVRHPATARHLATKLCRRFIAEAPPTAAVDAVAAAFTASDGDIRATMAALVATSDFRSPAVRGARLRRPFDHLTACVRATGGTTDGGPALTEYLRRLGHAPFQYPTPDGYPDEASAWTGGLLWRWRLAGALAHGRVQGTTIDGAELVRRCGSVDAALAHLYGRKPTSAESAALAAAGDDALALALSAPAFQRC